MLSVGIDPDSIPGLNKLDDDLDGNTEPGDIARYKNQLRRIQDQYDRLASQYEHMKELLKFKEDFLLAISHDFKTPLTVIHSAIQMLESFCGCDLTPKMRNYLQKIKQNNFRQIRLVNNILDIARISSGGLKLKLENMDIVLLTRLITESIASYAAYKDIKLGFESKLDTRVIAIDEEKYERILLNLLSNAIKFTPHGGSVTVSINCTYNANNKIIISVSDSGIGIPSDKIERLFSRFGQVDSNLSRQAEGTGIGLFLCRTLVEALGGEIRLHSAEGKGCIFDVLLNTAAVPETAASNAKHDIPVLGIDSSKVQQAIAIEFSDLYMVSG